MNNFEFNHDNDIIEINNSNNNNNNNNNNNTNNVNYQTNNINNNNNYNQNNNEVELLDNFNLGNNKHNTTTNNNHKKKRRRRKSFKEIINSLTTKQKVILILITFLLIALIIGLILYFVVFSDNKKENKPVNNEPTVVLEKDNYRYENGKLVFLNMSDKEIGTYECTNKETDLCYVTKLNFENDSFDRIMSVDKNGKELEKTSKIYFDKYVFVTDGDIINLYNMSTNEVELELSNIKVYDTKENYVVVQNDTNLYGLLEINEEGFQYVIRPSYDNLGIVNPNLNLILAQDKDKYYIINTDGEKLSKNINSNVKSANEEFIVININDTYNLYDYENNELLSDYDYISLHEKVVALVNNKRLYLMDNELNKLYEEGIRLTSTDYVKKYVYNEKLTLTKTLKSYEIETNNSEVIVKINDEETKVNLYDGLYSAPISYLNYFNGTLYFYSDEEKTDLLGKYKCNTENNLSEANSTLNNCNIYTNELGVSGIYNNEYVFIKDVKDNEVVYYLYNLKENKVKGTYSALEFVNENELKDDVTQVYTSSSYIIAVSATGANSGNYGILEIDSDSIQGKVNFKYQKITKQKNYFVMLSTDNAYSIYDKNLNKVSNEFSYIELFDKYYVGISDKLLNVYSYSDTKGILEQGITVNNNDFKIEFTNGFVITINNTVYKYDASGKKVTNSNTNNNTNNNGNSNNEDDESENNNNSNNDNDLEGSDSNVE